MRKGYLLTAILLFTAALVLGGLLTLTGSTWGWRSWSGSIIDGRVNTAAPWSMMNGGIMNGTMMNAGMMGGGLMNGAMINGGMMGAGDGTAAGEPLTLAEARQAVSDYLTARGDNGALEIGEIMIFSNHAYAQIIDADTGRGAFEVLIDPRTQAVFPEPGPTHMWNTDYGMLAGGNMMGV